MTQVTCGFQFVTLTKGMTHRKTHERRRKNDKVTHVRLPCPYPYVNVSQGGTSSGFIRVCLHRVCQGVWRRVWGKINKKIVGVPTVTTFNTQSQKQNTEDTRVVGLLIRLVDSLDFCPGVLRTSPNTVYRDGRQNSHRTFFPFYHKTLVQVHEVRPN